MKTAISVPDTTYERVEAKVHELGWNRSQFYATAAERLLSQLDQESLATAINDALETIGNSDDSGSAAVIAGRRTLAADN